MWVTQYCYDTESVMGWGRQETNVKFGEKNPWKISNCKTDEDKNRYLRQTRGTWQGAGISHYVHWKSLFKIHTT